MNEPFILQLSRKMNVAAEIAGLNEDEEEDITELKNSVRIMGVMVIGLKLMDSHPEYGRALLKDFFNFSPSEEALENMVKDMIEANPFSEGNFSENRFETW